ncbi:Cell division initiation protein OS=Streptomyces microflavus OX=1919 GN=Smic_60550 PE=4 SV=1 [Streptomyces microflavus]
MDVQKKLDEIVEAVGNARAMPMSASCVVNRAELLAMLEEVREALPGSLAHAQQLIGGQEQFAEQARQEAERIIQSAHAQRSSLIAETEIARQSQSEADRILSEARREAEEVRAEADDYVDSKLANFEVVLTKTIGSVDRGREKLLGRSQGLDEQGYQDPDFAEAPERSADPETLRQRADAYVDAKFGAFEAVLAKTLEAVGRGRQKLLGRVASDDLGAHMAAQDAAGAQGHTSDADYLAGLAELATPEPRQAPPQPLYQEPQQPQAEAGYAPTEYAPTEYGQPEYAQAAYGYQEQPHRSRSPRVCRTRTATSRCRTRTRPTSSPPTTRTSTRPSRRAGRTTAGSSSRRCPPQQNQGALDETSLFDTSMIDLEQLRRYEGG